MQIGWRALRELAKLRVQRPDVLDRARHLLTRAHGGGKGKGGAPPRSMLHAARCTLHAACSAAHAIRSGCLVV